MEETPTRIQTRMGAALSTAPSVCSSMPPTEDKPNKEVKNSGGTLKKRGDLAGASMKFDKEKKTMKNAGDTMEERGVLALEKVAGSMEALVRTTMLEVMMNEDDENGVIYQGSIPNHETDHQYSTQ